MPTIQNKTVIFLLSILISIFSFLSLAQTTFAAGSYGWFSPKVTYVNDTTPANIGCAAGQASIEFRLVSNGTQTPITSNSGPWTVKIRQDRTSMTELASLNFTAGTKQSTPVCFDPSTNGLQITVNDSASYHRFEGPTLFPSSGDLSSMANKHFRGFLELESKSEITPSIESVSPNGEVFAGQPTFNVKTNSLSSSYGASRVTLTRFYIVNQADPDTAIIITDNTDRLAGANFNFTPTAPVLSEGVYFWTFQQELNGSTSTRKTSSPSFLWTFSQIPSSGAPNPLSFTVDKSAPKSTLTYSVNSISGSDANVRITNKVSDVYGTLASSTISIYRGSILINAKSYDFINTNDSEHAFDQDLTVGNTYTIYATTTDKSGYSTSTSKVINLTGSYLPPVISGLDLVSTIPRSIRADVDNNSLTVNAWGTCWSTSNLSTSTFFTSASSTCTHSNVLKNNNFTIDHSYNSIPNGVEIYMMVYAHNLGGTTTALFSESLATSSASSSPTIAYVPPIAPIKSFSLDPGVQILSTGAGTSLLKHGICWFSSVASRDSFVFNSTNLSSGAAKVVDGSCRVWRDTNSVKSWAYRADFVNNISAGTTYYFKAFAENSSGWAFDIGEATTTPLTHQFDHLSGYSPVIQYTRDMSNFNDNTKTYNNISVQIAAVDNSTDITVVPRRTVGFTAKLYKDDGGALIEVDSISGVTLAHYAGETGSSTLDSLVTFNDVALGAYEITVTFTSASDLPLGSTPTYDSKTKSVLLTHPNIDLGTIVGDESSTSSVLIVDPELRLWATPTLVRAGQTAALNWSMNNVGVDLQCEINGPKNTNTFPTSGTGAGLGTYSFNVAFASNTNITGNISSGELSNTQLFELKCLNGTEEFATTTRVNTLGTVQEI